MLSTFPIFIALLFHIFEEGVHHGHEAAGNGVCRASENFAG